MATIGLVEAPACHRAVAARVAEGDHVTLGACQPVPAVVGGTGDADYLLAEVPSGRRAVETGVAEVEHPTVGAGQPVALARAGRVDRHDGDGEVGTVLRAEVRRIAVVAQLAARG